MTKKQKRELRNILTAGALYALLLILEHLVHIPVLFDRWYFALFCEKQDSVSKTGRSSMSRF